MSSLSLKEQMKKQCSLLDMTETKQDAVFVENHEGAACCDTLGTQHT